MNRYATISTESLQQWFSSHPVTLKVSEVNLSESSEVLVKRRINAAPISARLLMKAQKEAICQEFVNNMKQFYKTKFKETVLKPYCVVNMIIECSHVPFGGGLSESVVALFGYPIKQNVTPGRPRHENQYDAKLTVWLLTERVSTLAKEQSHWLNPSSLCLRSMPRREKRKKNHSNQIL